jgi:Alginate lyase
MKLPVVMRNIFFSLLCCFYFQGIVKAQHDQSNTFHTYLFDSNRLPILKKAFQQQVPAIVKSVNKLVAEADNMLRLVPGSVMDKSTIPPSGDKHDYMSLAPYFWPDPSKPDSLPYIRKDGQRNPMIERISDKRNLAELGKVTHTLALAYALTGDEQYAIKAAAFLKKWFIDPATSMNPNLTFAQAVLGVNDGRGIGIIETISLTAVVDALGLLANSKVLSRNEQNAINEWFENYLKWMLTSKNGMDEKNALNNHGIWYDMQVLSFSLFLHKEAFIKNYIPSILQRIPVQFETDGRLPLELERTTALGYSTYCLEAWFKTAILASKAGFDIWHYQTNDGKSIQKGLDWLLPFAMGEKKWTYQQIKPYAEWDKLYFLLLMADQQFQQPKYSAFAHQIKAKELEIIDLLYGKVVGPQ